LSGRAPACASAAPLCAAIGAFLPGAWRVAPLGCISAPVLARDIAVLEPHVRRQPITHRFHQLGQPLRKPSPLAARSARISIAGSPAPPRPRTLQSFAPCRRRKFPSKPRRAAAPPFSASIPAEAACKPRMRCKGTRSNDERHSSQMGTRLAFVSSRSHIRQSEGKNMLTTASPISASQPRPGRDRPRTLHVALPPLDELPSATQPELYCSSRFN